jgi:hypothetical protein
VRTVHKKHRAARGFASGAALAAVGLSVATLAGPAGADVTAVSGSAFGASVNVGIDHDFDPGTPRLPVVLPPTPEVTLAPSGGNEAASVPAMSVGPGGVFLTSGPLSVTTAGTTGPTGSSTSTATVLSPIVLGVLTAASVSSTCTASETGGLTGSTAITNGSLVQNATTTVTLDAAPAPNTTYQGVDNREGGSGDTFTVILNEQTVTAESITVTAVHVILGGPLATGDIYVGQSHCDFSTVAAPQTKDSCKNGGWMAFPQAFKNQGECVAFVERSASAA